MSEHACTPESCPEPSSYFVTAVDGNRVHYMAGPYQTHSESLADVDKARNLANKHDSSGRAWFMSWGTVRMREESNRVGSLNKAKLI